MGFHPEMDRTSAAHNRAEKERRVREGRAHATLVYDGSTCVGWCQFGSAEELPGIKYKRAYDEGGGALPDFRITCLFVDRKHRSRRVAATALAGALDEIARLGGGTVETYPEDFNERAVSKSLPYMYNGPAAMFERHGFVRIRRLGKHHWVMTKVVAAVPRAETIPPADSKAF